MDVERKCLIEKRCAVVPLSVYCCTLAPSGTVIVTVSLATAMLPRLSAFAADSDLGGLARSVASTLRTAYGARAADAPRGLPPGRWPPKAARP